MPAPGGERIREDVEDDGRVLHPLHRDLEGGVLEGHDHFRLGVERRVEQVRQGGQITLSAGRLEDIVSVTFHALFLKADLERILAPFGADPVGRADEGDGGRRRGRGCRAGGPALVGRDAFVATKGDAKDRGERRVPDEGLPNGPTLPPHATASQADGKNFGAKRMILCTPWGFRKKTLPDRPSGLAAP